MVQIISRTKNLQSFAYDNGGASVSETGNFASKSVVWALVEYAAHSLKELMIINANEEDQLDLDDEGDFTLSIPWWRFEKLRAVSRVAGSNGHKS